MIFEFKKDESGTLVRIEDATLGEVAAMSLYMLNIVFNRMKAAGPELAEEYRRMIIKGVLDSRSPAWMPIPISPNDVIQSQVIRVDKSELRKQMKEE